MAYGSWWERIARGLILTGAISGLITFLLELAGILVPTVFTPVAGLILAIGFLLLAGCRLAGVIQAPAPWWDSAWFNTLIGICVLISSSYRLFRPHIADPSVSGFDKWDLGVSIVVVISIVAVFYAFMRAGAKRQNQ